jgi:hypothetical protein
MPLSQTGQTRPKVVFDKEIPLGARRAQVGTDPGNDFAVINLVGVEQQRDVVRRVTRLALDCAPPGRRGWQLALQYGLRQKRYPNRRISQSSRPRANGRMRNLLIDAKAKISII